MGRDSPWGRLRQDVSHVLFGRHPYGAPIIGHPETLESMQVDLMRGWYERTYQPCMGTLVLAGDLHPSSTMSLVRKHFGKVSRGEPAPFVHCAPLRAPEGERRIEKRKGVWSKIEAAAAGEGEFIRGDYESQERVELMIHAIEFNEPGVIYLNVMNDGAIPNVLPEACVELPVVVDSHGFHPVHIGNLPPGPAAITNLAAAVQDLTVEAALNGDRQLALQALALDPLTYTLELEETERMLDEMLEASRPVLPRFFD